MADAPIPEPRDDALDPAARGEIVAHGPEGALDRADKSALLHWLEQSHRDAQASRAQTRELVRALEQVRDAHEYVGRALRDEQKRSRRLTFALVLAPVLAALAIWGIWDRLDALRGDVSARIESVATEQQELRRAQEELRFGEAAEAQAARADALAAELERARQDLATERASTTSRAEARAAEEAALRARIERLEDDNAEVDGLRAQLQALRSRTGAESARAQELEREIRRLERELGAVQAGAVAAAAPASRETPPAPPPAAVPSADPPGDVLPAAGPAAELPGPESAPDPLAGAVRSPEDLARIRDELNRLLALAADAVTYRVDGLGGVRGATLLDVRLSGVDGGGRAVRTLEAGTATVHVRGESDDVLLDLRDGHLLLAGRKAPFFDGRYAIVVPGQSEAWRVSGLTCVTFD